MEGEDVVCGFEFGDGYKADLRVGKLVIVGSVLNVGAWWVVVVPVCCLGALPLCARLCWRCFQ